MVRNSNFLSIILKRDLPVALVLSWLGQFVDWTSGIPIQTGRCNAVQRLKFRNTEQPRCSSDAVQSTDALPQAPHHLEAHVYVNFLEHWSSIRHHINGERNWRYQLSPHSLLLLSPIPTDYLHMEQQQVDTLTVHSSFFLEKRSPHFIPVEQSNSRFQPCTI